MGIGAVKAVFLDRDGVLNEAVVREGRPYPPSSVEDLKVIPGTPEALARLKAAGFLLVVVTNQPDVAKGTQSRGVVETINAALRAALPIDDFFVCWHDDRDACSCRKPKPGLLLAAAARYGIDLAASFMVGDRWRDIDAGASAGCRTVLIERDYHERGPSAEPNFRTISLESAANWMIANELMH